LAGFRDDPIRDVKQEQRCRRDSGGGIGFRAVVEHPEFGQVRQQTNQVDAAALVPLTNLLVDLSKQWV
jgi:hypothetical protein